VTRTDPPAGPGRTPSAASLPRHRAIVAVDIEQSTSRLDPVKAELRHALYELFDQALCSAGIHKRHRDRFTDRGDGLLALIHPRRPGLQALLLNHAVPALSQLLSGYNASPSRVGRPHQQLRVRVVVHAGEIHYDGNGCFGEALDIAFRPLIRVHVAGHRYPGWVRTPRDTAQLRN
jgi:class 3 adenylate cyclase